MTQNTLTEEKSRTLNSIVARFASDCDAAAVAVCDAGGNILAHELQADVTTGIENSAALAAGSLAATRALAATVGETGFRSMFHRGHKSSIMIQTLSPDFFILVILGKNSVEGLVRLCARKVARQLESVLSQTDAQTDEEAGPPPDFQAHEVADTDGGKPHA